MDIVKKTELECAVIRAAIGDPLLPCLVDICMVYGDLEMMIFEEHLLRYGWWNLCTNHVDYWSTWLCVPDTAVKQCYTDRVARIFAGNPNGLGYCIVHAMGLGNSTDCHRLVCFYQSLRCNCGNPIFP